MDRLLKKIKKLSETVQTRLKIASSLHARLTDKSWLAPFPINRPFIALLLFATLIAAGANYLVRAHQYTVWEENKSIFFLGETPLFSTADAPYYLALAKTYKEDKKAENFHRKRNYPSWKKREKFKDIPLLSKMVSFMASSSSREDLLKAGNRMIPVTAFLTVIMIILAFGATGYWLEGTVAATGAGLSQSYLFRSAAGRIDTDQLNLGLFYLVTAFIIFSARSKSYRFFIFFALLAGSAMFLLQSWHPKSVSFAPFFLFVFVFLSVFTHRKVITHRMVNSPRNWKLSLLFALFFLLFSTAFLLDVNWVDKIKYLFISYIDASDFNIASSRRDALVFPNILSTVSEVAHIDVFDFLKLTSGSILVGLVSTVGVLFWGIRHPALAVAFLPALGLGLLAFIVGRRTIFYAAPIFWFGFAWLLFTGGRYFMSKYQPRLESTPLFALPLLLLSFGTIYLVSPVNYIPRPSFPAPIIAGLQKLDNLPDKEKAIMMSWWDYGYSSLFFNGLNITADGGSNEITKAHYMARALLAPSQKETAGLLKFLASTNIRKIQKELNPAGEVNRAIFAHAKNDIEEDIYFVLTSDMARWMPAISKLGLWDTEKGVPLELIQSPAGNNILSYYVPRCVQEADKAVFNCDNRQINLEKGLVDNEPILAGVVTTRGGKQTGGLSFKRENEQNVIHIQTDNPRQLIFAFMHKRLFQSSFHQMFNMGRIDQDYFELVYEGYPFIRIYRLKKVK